MNLSSPDLRRNSTLNSDLLLKTYETVFTIRCFEEKVMDLRNAGLVPGSVHLCCGQEAIPVGACRALEARDALTVTYRGHGWAIARGIPLAELFAEIMARDSALCGGRAGSPFFSAPDYGLLGENSIVGGGAPIAAGAALAARYDGSGAVSLLSIGDGAMNQGAVHEALNFAAVFDLPLVVVVENNVYSEMTPIRDMVKVKKLAERAAGYGIPGVTIDGNDAEAVFESVAGAVKRARSGAGPMLIEAMTERLVGHYSGDVQHYRPKGEVEAARTREPLARLRSLAASLGIESELRVVDSRVKESIEAAVEKASACSLPDPATAKDHLYVR